MPLAEAWCSLRESKRTLVTSGSKFKEWIGESRAVLCGASSAITDCARHDEGALYAVAGTCPVCECRSVVVGE